MRILRMKRAMEFLQEGIYNVSEMKNGGRIPID